MLLTQWKVTVATDDLKMHQTLTCMPMFRTLHPLSVAKVTNVALAQCLKYASKIISIGYGALECRSQLPFLMSTY